MGDNVPTAFDRDAHHGRLGPATRTLILGGLGLLCGAVMLGSVMFRASAPAAASRTSADVTVPALVALTQAQTATVQLGTASDALTTVRDTPSLVAAFSQASTLWTQQTAAWSRFLSLVQADKTIGPLRREFESAASLLQTAAGTVGAAPPGTPGYVQAVTAAQASINRQETVLAQLAATFGSRAAQEADSVRAGLDGVRFGSIVAYLALAVTFLVVGVIVMRSARRDERVLGREAASSRERTRKAELESRLQRALEVRSSEEGCLQVVRRAVTELVDDSVEIEVLTEDSSQAQLRRVEATEARTGVGCQANSPRDCPVVTSGRTWAFPEGSILDSCPWLGDEPDPGRSVCVPIHVAGQSIGVIRAHTRNSGRDEGALRDDLEVVGRKAGERLATLRILAVTEKRAQTDPLTGLPNRRALQERANAAQVTESDFAVAFVDLDHFKDVNDGYGHDVGDRALRLFSRALRDGTRPTDLVARWGGEEFVVVLPECGQPDAEVVAERIREHLRAALAHGTVPPFTVTIGLAASLAGEDLADVIARADQAMLQGKSDGRDRVVTFSHAVGGSSSPIGQPR